MTTIDTLPRWAGWRVGIEAAGASLEAELTRPAGAKGLVLSALASMEDPGALREADYLHTRGLATLRFAMQDDDVERLGRLLFGAALWAGQCPETRDLALGLAGTGQAAAAALAATAALGPGVKAVVLRSGRPDLVDAILPRVQAPTLFILGGRDPEGIVLNRTAYRRVPATKALCVVPDATARFEDAFAQEEAGELMAAWFLEHLAPED
jgi:pimeloyl-ACP methyl ester carboxylesterase